MQFQNFQICGDWAPYNRSVAPISSVSKLIVNLEGPILTADLVEYTKTYKAGPSLFNFEIPSTSQPGLAILSNNHLMDFGLQGLEETTKALNSAGWRYTGAGFTKSAAQAPVIFDCDNARIGVLARCETQFGVATETKGGVAAFDPSIYDQIRVLKNNTDFVIVSVHAAAEMVPWPSPKRQQAWRSRIDAGANVVHGHLSHVPQGWEEYKGGLIFYGLGNFCVDPKKWSWHPNGLWSLAPLILLGGGRVEMRPCTTVIEDHGEGIAVRESTPGEALRHHEYLSICNKPLRDRILLEGLWQEVSIRMYHGYYQDWLGFNSSIRKDFFLCAHSLLRLIRRAFVGKTKNFDALRAHYLLLYHLFVCDSHNDAISTALGSLGGELDDLRTEETAALVNKWVLNR
jgi:poly-gamma-glutamate synthesis protein (capsule biosynthesis protein)